VLPRCRRRGNRLFASQAGNFCGIPQTGRAGASRRRRRVPSADARLRVRSVAPREEKTCAPGSAREGSAASVKGGGAKAAGRAGAAARADDPAAKEKALREANERIAMLEKNVENLQKLAQLKSASTIASPRRFISRSVPSAR